MPIDHFFDELFEYESDLEIGSAESDEHAKNILGSYCGIDIVANQNRRSGKPTVAGTRLEPLIMVERVFSQTLEFMISLLPSDEFSQQTKENLIEHYYEHPHDVPKIVPKDQDWAKYHKIDDISYDIYKDKIKNAYKLSVIEIASRRDFTYPRMIHAMCLYYEDDTENIELLRRHSYDARFCLSNLGGENNGVTFIQENDDLDGYFVSEDGKKYNNYSDFMQDSWDGSWPPTNMKFIDHKATFGEDRPPG